MVDVGNTAEFGYFRDIIMDTYKADLKRMNSIPSGAIEAALSKDPFDLTPEQLDSIRRYLEFTFSVRQEMGTPLIPK